MCVLAVPLSIVPKCTELTSLSKFPSPHSWLLDRNMIDESISWGKVGESVYVSGSTPEKNNTKQNKINFESLELLQRCVLAIPRHVRQTIFIEVTSLWLLFALVCVLIITFNWPQWNNNGVYLLFNSLKYEWDVTVEIIVDLLFNLLETSQLMNSGAIMR